MDAPALRVPQSNGARSKRRDSDLPSPTTEPANGRSAAEPSRAAAQPAPADAGLPPPAQSSSQEVVIDEQTEDEPRGQPDPRPSEPHIEVAGVRGE